MKYKPCYVASLVLSLFALVSVICPSARATYIATLNEVGGNVVGSGSGSLDVTGLSFAFVGIDNARVEGSIAALILGPTGSTFIDVYNGISGPANFGSGSFIDANSGAGNIVGFSGAAFNLAVPTGYVSGSLLGISTATWNSATFASLGITPGTYVWTWGTGIHADSYTLIIGTGANGVPDTGSTIALMFGALATLVVWRRLLPAAS